MAYDIKCTFFINKENNQEIISKGIINDLKIINLQKYAISLNNINITNDKFTLHNNEIKGNYSIEYSFSVPSDLIIEYDKIRWNIKDCLNYYCSKYDQNDDKKFIVDSDKQDLIDLLKDYETEYSMEDIINKSDDNDIAIYEVIYNEENNGYVYDQNSFIQGALYYYGKMENERKNIIKIKNIIDSTEYYKFDLHQRENITEDLQSATESLEIFETSYLACTKMINLFEYFGREELTDGKLNDMNKLYCYISAV